MADGYLCRVCSKVISSTKNGRYRSHKNGDGESCETSSTPIPDDLLTQAPSDTKTAGVPEEGKDFALCPDCGRNVKLTRLGYFEDHKPTLCGGERCPAGGSRYRTRPIDENPLPGDEVPEKGVYNAQRPKVTAQREVEQGAAGVTPATATPGAEAAAPASEGVSTPSPPEDLMLQRNLAATPWLPTPEELSASAPSGKGPSATGTSLPPDWPPEPPYDEEGDSGEPILPLTGFWIPAELLEGHGRILQPGPLEPREEVVPYAPEAAASGASTETNSPASATTSRPSPTPPPELSPSLTGTASEGPFPLGPSYSSRISQPVSLIMQPSPYSGPEKPEPMGDLAKELATRIKETFYAYDNRKSLDNRSAQTTLGPSEIGTPCDRRLAMTLLGIPPVNPGGDGWAAFVGTCGHVGMGEVYTFADAGTGRYAVEMPVFFPSELVPRGTTDNLDRRDGTLIDWKFMGAYSLKKFKTEGPSETYRIQAQTYGLGATLGGEKVRNVAIVGLPRAGSSLDEMHIWTEKFDRKVGEAALKRVADISSRARFGTDGTMDTPMTAAKRFETANDCRYCPFYLKTDKEMRRGCPGS